MGRICIFCIRKKRDRPLGNVGTITTGNIATRHPWGYRSDKIDVRDQIFTCAVVFDLADQHRLVA
jgi:hypothetical protein